MTARRNSGKRTGVSNERSRFRVARSKTAMVTPNTIRPLVRSCSRMLMMGSRAAASAALGGVAIQASCLLATERHRSDALETRRRFTCLRAPVRLCRARGSVRPRRRSKAWTARAHDRVCARRNPGRSGATELAYAYLIESMADRLLDPVRHSARGVIRTRWRRDRSDQLTEWPGAELNRRHRDFQSRALPTELPGRDGDEPLAAPHRAVNQRPRADENDTGRPAARAGRPVLKRSRTGERLPSRRRWGRGADELHAGDLLDAGDDRRGAVVPDADRLAQPDWRGAERRRADRDADALAVYEILHLVEDELERPLAPADGAGRIGRLV